MANGCALGKIKLVENPGGPAEIQEVKKMPIICLSDARALSAGHPRPWFESEQQGVTDRGGVVRVSSSADPMQIEVLPRNPFSSAAGLSLTRCAIPDDWSSEREIEPDCR